MSTTKPTTRKAKKPRKPWTWKRVLKWVVVTGFTFFFLGVVALFVAYRLVGIPDANADFQTQTTTAYYSDGKHKIGT
ncbi:MAG: penicillin-binding protein, partial [Nocardioidaceae bacterium]|nr:penicillin-binding protein [Nocardioidaceae bacterium]